MSADNTWIIAMNGGASSICEHSSFVGMDYDKPHMLPEKPVEDGAFFTANKWAMPYRAIVTLAKAGTAGEIGNFISALETYNGSTELVSIVTPVRVFIDGNIEAIRYSFNNDEQGPRMVMPQISIKEVMFVKTSTTTGKISYGNSKDASAADTASGGECQTKQMAQMEQGSQRG